MTSKNLVFDNGTGLSKIGIAGEDQPRFVFPTLTGYQKHDTRQAENFQYPDYDSHDEIWKIPELSLISPMEHGLIIDWPRMEEIWQYCYEKLKIPSKNQPIFLIDNNPLVPVGQREKIAEIFFETFKVPALNLSYQQVLTLYASGRTTGLVVNMGESGVSIVPIYEGFAVPHSIRHPTITGQNLTQYLQNLLAVRGYTFNLPRDMNIFHKLKEQMCYIALKPGKEFVMGDIHTPLEKTYHLPDGRSLTIGAERFMAPELYFQPSFFGSEDESLTERIYSTIQRCDIELRPELFQNIVLSGGLSMFPGLKERLHQELTDLVPEGIEIRLVTPPERQYSSWIGGSIIGSLNKNFSRLVVTQQEYLEQGPVAIRRFI